MHEVCMIDKGVGEIQTSGVRWICEGLGLSEDRIKYERKKIQKDLVLNQGVKFYSLEMIERNRMFFALNWTFFRFGLRRFILLLQL